jgi:DNA polymerase III subunit alpha
MSQLSLFYLLVKIFLTLLHLGVYMLSNTVEEKNSILKAFEIICETLHLLNGHRTKEGLGEIDIDEIPLNDVETFKQLRSDLTNDLFLLWIPEMQEWLPEMQERLITRLTPVTFKDIIALIALFRPGPMESGITDDYINRKEKRVPVEYPLPQSEQILRETYGIILYQEQMVMIAQEVAKFSIDESDCMYKVMCAKNRTDIELQRVLFLKGAEENNINPKEAEYIFDLMAKFVGYVSSKADCTKYATILYKTAWLKTNFQEQYMTVTNSQRCI